MKNLNDILQEALDCALEESGIKHHVSERNKNVQQRRSSDVISEAYVAEAGKFDLQTELLSSKTKKAHQELLEGYVKELNNISSKLDGVDKSGANLNNSSFRSLKVDETYNHNAAFLHGLYFENISSSIFKIVFIVTMLPTIHHNDRNHTNHNAVTVQINNCVYVSS